jgi:hypothetical protein
METKLYRMYGIDVAMQLLRPNAKWEISNTAFTRWEDPRPCPSWEEVQWVMDKIREFEDSIPTIWLPEDLEKMKIESDEFDKAIGEADGTLCTA